ncbi:hypothetical protein Tco_1382927 [Tanacetum coccineum]
MAFDLRPTEDVLPWPGNANMAFDLRPTEDVLPWPGNANMAFDLVPDLQCLLLHYILLGRSSKTRALWKLSCLLEAARQSLACIRLGLRGQSYLHAPSTSCGPDVCAIRTLDCWPLPPMETASPLEKTLFLTSRGDITSPPEDTFSPLRRHCSLPPKRTLLHLTEKTLLLTSLEDITLPPEKH